MLFHVGSSMRKPLRQRNVATRRHVNLFETESVESYDNEDPVMVLNKEDTTPSAHLDVANTPQKID